MTYDNTWDDTLPLDSSDADLIAADIRSFKIDVHQRLNSLIGAGTINDTLTDPVVAADHSLNTLRGEMTTANALLATKTFNLYSIGASGTIVGSAGVGLSPTQVTQTTIYHAQAVGPAALAIFYKIGIPVGCTVTGIRIYASTNGGGTFSAAVSSTDCSTGSITVVSTTTLSGVSLAQDVTVGLPLTILTELLYGIRIDSIPAAGITNVLVGLRITYTSPDANHRI